ncbi:MAG: DMT family transporter, partial [Gammaproteobacteria bacterium]
ATVESEQTASTRAAYLGVILIWSTTPLAINWSSIGAGPLFGVASRMLLGALLALAVIQLRRIPLPLHREALKTYLAGGIPMFGAMSTVYLASQYIPSGWISVIFGLTPVITGLMASLWLGERAFTPAKSLGMALAFAGLVVMFKSGMILSDDAIWGVLGVLLSSSIHSGSAVLIKRVNAGLSGLAVTVGSLWVALPLFLGSWALFGQPMPESLPARSLLGIVYLGIVGSVLGFSLYYHVLRHMEASKVALITLITPAGGLLIGNVLNAEPISGEVAFGTGLIILGLAIYDLLPKLLKRRTKKSEV